MNSVSLLKGEGLYKSYPQGKGELAILKGLSLEIFKGESVCILGASGSGKSTLLHILGTLDLPQAGVLFYEGKNILNFSEDELSKFRNHEMGFVFQFHHLLPEFTALENVMIPGKIQGLSPQECQARALELLTLLGLADRGHHFPSELSGGELQRVAIARALVCRPKILFADEPTGNLDSQTAQRVQDLFFALKEQFQLTLVVVTHDLQFARRFPRTYRLQDGVFTSKG